jgi:hypothetical protein
VESTGGDGSRDLVRAAGGGGAVATAEMGGLRVWGAESDESLKRAAHVLLAEVTGAGTGAGAGGGGVGDLGGAGGGSSTTGGGGGGAAALLWG